LVSTIVALNKFHTEPRNSGLTHQVVFNPGVEVDGSEHGVIANALKIAKIREHERICEDADVELVILGITAKLEILLKASPSKETTDFTAEEEIEPNSPASLLPFIIVLLEITLAQSLQ